MEKVLVIVGPTGVGKTSLSVELAKACKGEVISGDSMQVYKEMSIGTAKITKEEMQDIPHYLIDLCSFTEEYNVKIFQEKAREYIQKITKSERLPIIVEEPAYILNPVCMTISLWIRRKTVIL